jgi:amino acid transporter
MSTAIPPQGNDEARTRENPRVGADGRPGPGHHETVAPGHREVVARQKDEFGGMKFGAGFFGWLAATGMAVLLSAITAGVVAAAGLNQNVDPAAATSGSWQTAGVVGGIVLLVIILIAYFCGGYVAGRMARFNGLKQGVAVWLWAIIVTIVLVIIGAIAGSQYDLLSQVQGLPNVGVNTGRVTTAGVLAAVGVAVVALVGAILGGLAGMRFHRRVDKVGLS